MESITKLDALRRASQVLQAAGSPREAADWVVHTLEGLGYEYAAVLEYEPGARELRPLALSRQGFGVAFEQADMRYVLEQGVALGQGITGWVAEHRLPTRCGDVRRDPRYRSLRPDIGSELCVPILAPEEDRLLGVLNVETTRLGAYSDEDEGLLVALAALLAQALRGAQAEPAPGPLLAFMATALGREVEQLQELLGANRLDPKVLVAGRVQLIASRLLAASQGGLGATGRADCVRVVEEAWSGLGSLLGPSWILKLKVDVREAWTPLSAEQLDQMLNHLVAAFGSLAGSEGQVELSLRAEPGPTSMGLNREEGGQVVLDLAGPLGERTPGGTPELGAFSAELRRWGGRLEVREDVTEGLRLRVMLPSLPDPSSVPARIEGEPLPPARILLVEPERSSRDYLQGLLTRSGHQVHVVRDSGQALEYAGLGGTQLDLLITDVQMAGGDGLSFLRRYQAQQPESGILVLTEYLWSERELQGAMNHGVPVITRPFHGSDLASGLRRALGQVPTLTLG